MPRRPAQFLDASDTALRHSCEFFTPRQLVALTTFSDLVMVAREKVLADAEAHWSGEHADDTRRLADGGLGPIAYADAVATYLALAVDRKWPTTHSTIASWTSDMEQRYRATFARQAIADDLGLSPRPIRFRQLTGDFIGSSRLGARCVGRLQAISAGQIECKDRADQCSFLTRTISTDPPYYDNIGYADLSDYLLRLASSDTEAHSSRTVSPRCHSEERRNLSPRLIGTAAKSASRGLLSGRNEEGACAAIAKASADVPGYDLLCVQAVRIVRGRCDLGRMGKLSTGRC